ncbi:MAG TPA: NADPH-dependent F420 reductase [Anaerolineales bacterium]|nr:NADPH-dependent F420 reductase [Anaerolineaceae bacterium]HJO90185.1 NADPH-dependent F420 reductase [Anaerolineales bacterium]|tara:strand:- start:439 stop:1113 length:675 start_codon:yes stop_codon:yes gene_type:complete
MLPSISIIGGTGAEGSGLALRWAYSGYSVTIGSRSLDKALSKAAELNIKMPDTKPQLIGDDNLAAAKGCQIAVLTVPYNAHRETLLDLKEDLQGKILVDVTVPLMPPKVDQVHIPAGDAAGLEAQEILGPDVRVVSAFQNISAAHLQAPERIIDCDVLVCGNDTSACEEVIVLVEAAGMSGLHAGSLVNAIAIESFTPVLISLNKHYKIRDAGIRVTGIARTEK